MRAPLGRLGSIVIWRLLFWTAVVAGIVLALWPAPDEPPHWFPHSDKLKHAGSFAVLLWLGWRSQFRSMRWLSIGLLALGAAIEVAQSFTPTRSADVRDWLADAAGIAIGLGVVAWIGRRSRALPQKDRGQPVVD